MMRLINRKNKAQTQQPINPPPVVDENTGNTTEQYDDLGFGTNYTATGRFINANGEFNIERRGVGFRGLSIYQWLVTSSWLNFFLVVLGIYIISNAIFALLFLACGMHSLSGVEHGTWLENFAQAFFFSVQTFTTVGYGSMSPVGFWANVIAALNALYGLMAFALFTGLFFARFSRPVAKVQFSKKALIAPYRDITGFMFRVVNLRRNNLMDVSANVVITWLEDKNGRPVRQFRRLDLERYSIAMFPLNWTIVHPIDEKSPLFNKNAEALKKMNVEFIIILKGYDDTFAQFVNIHNSYKFEEMLIGAKFKKMYHVDADGEMVLEIDKIDEVEVVENSVGI
jgi:inward rectifier potassium channel